MKLSIVVPIYNKAAYLPELFKSLQNQGLNSEEYEIILINDGSSDDSDSICQSFIKAHEDKKIRYFYQKNAGVSAARNVGIDSAAGEYIHFMDCDDALIAEAYVKVLLFSKAADYDYIGFGFKQIDLRKNNSSYEVSTGDAAISPQEVDGLQLVRNVKWPSSSVIGLYRVEFLLSHNIRFPEGVSTGEDVWFNCDFFLNSPRCLLTPLRPYLYFFRMGSIMTSVSAEKADKWFHSYYSLFSHLLDYYKNTPPVQKYQENIDIEAIQKGLLQVLHHHIAVFLPKALEFGLNRKRFKDWAIRYTKAGILPTRAKGLYLRVADIIFRFPTLYPVISWGYRNVFRKTLYRWVHK